jgi:hypothetical protein
MITVTLKDDKVLIYKGEHWIYANPRLLQISNEEGVTYINLDEIKAFYIEKE